MNRFWMLTSASAVVLCLAAQASAQTPWLTTVEQAVKEAELIRNAADALLNAQKLSPRPEIEAAIKAVNVVAGKLSESPGFKKAAEGAPDRKSVV